LPDAISLASYDLMIAFSLAFPFQQQSAVLVFALLTRLPAVQFCTVCTSVWFRSPDPHAISSIPTTGKHVSREMRQERSSPLSFKVEEQQYS